MTGFILTIYLKTFRKMSRIPILRRIWRELYDHIGHVLKNKPAKIRLHGFNVTLPFDSVYPITSRVVKTYNNPLIECVHQINRLSREKLIIFDIGAAIGDTVMLIQANCPNMVAKFFCVEGDKEFLSYLKSNTEQFDNVTCIDALLSDTSSKIRKLVRTHAGTASAQGESYTEAISFDELTESLNIVRIDLIKIDTDGYDGKILIGAKESILRYQPMIIFEWHPILCIKTENDYKEHFKILLDLGYETFIWFTKFGVFSHFTYEPTEKYIDQFAEICIKAEFDTDWHYDVIALHKQTDYSIIDFANSTYSRNKISPY